MKPIPVVALAVLAVTVAAAGTAWHFREPIRARLSQTLYQFPAGGPATALPAVAQAMTGEAGTATAPAHPETVYRWVDASGVTHFGQHGGSGREAVTVDTGRIRPMELGAEAGSTSR